MTGASVGILLRETVEEAKPEADLDAQLPHALNAIEALLYLKEPV